VNRRDQADAAAAVQVLLKSTGAEARRCASATLAGLGVDEYTVLAEAQAAMAVTGTPGPLSKAASRPGEITLRVPMDAGGTLTLQASPAEANALVCAAFDALGGRRA
jgi:hypothetical protein